MIRLFPQIRPQNAGVSVHVTPLVQSSYYGVLLPWLPWLLPTSHLLGRRPANLQPHHAILYLTSTGYLRVHIYVHT